MPVTHKDRPCWEHALSTALDTTHVSTSMRLASISDKVSSVVTAQASFGTSEAAELRFTNIKSASFAAQISRLVNACLVRAGSITFAASDLSIGHPSVAAPTTRSALQLKVQVADEQRLEQQRLLEQWGLMWQVHKHPQRVLAAAWFVVFVVAYTVDTLVSKTSRNGCCSQLDEHEDDDATAEEVQPLASELQGRIGPIHVARSENTPGVTMSFQV
jgi:hypothetical protein